MVPEWPPWEWEDRAILGLLQTWLQNWKACTPHFRGISLLLKFIDDDFDDWNFGMRHQLRELRVEAEVKLDIIDLTGET